MTTRSIFQSHECAGYSAKVTIEWTVPARVDADQLPAWRLGKAEEIAEDLLAKLGPQTMEMVKAMRGE